MTKYLQAMIGDIVLVLSRKFNSKKRKNKKTKIIKIRNNEDDSIKFGRKHVISSTFLPSTEADISLSVKKIVETNNGHV